MYDLVKMSGDPFIYFKIKGLISCSEVSELLENFPDNLSEYISDSHSKYRIENATLAMWRLKRTAFWSKIFEKFSAFNLILLAKDLEVKGSSNFAPASLNPLVNLFNTYIRNKKLVISSFEFSVLINGASLVPHTDSRNKIFTLMLYVPTAEQDGRTDLGTTFHGFKDDVADKYENFNNQHYKKEIYPDFYTDQQELYSVPYSSHAIHGFVKSSYSWHSMYPVELASNERRRSININLYYYNRSAFSLLFEHLKFVIKHLVKRKA